MTFNNKTIEELHNLLVSKEISSTELTQATLEDIKSRETAINAFVTIAEDQALAQAKAIDEAGIDADNVFLEFPWLLRIISLQTVFSQLLPQKCSTTTSQSLMRQPFQCKSKGMIVVGKTNMDDLPWVVQVRLLTMVPLKMLGTTARCLVDLLVVQQLL